MSLQDDYFDLSESLKGHQKETLDRIWEAFCELEEEYDHLLAIRNSLRNLIELSFKDEIKFLERKLDLTDPKQS